LKSSPGTGAALAVLGACGACWRRTATSPAAPGQRPAGRAGIKACLLQVPRLVQRCSLSPSSAAGPTSGSWESLFPAVSQAKGMGQIQPPSPRAPAPNGPQTTQTSKQALPLTALSSLLRKETVCSQIPWSDQDCQRVIWASVPEQKNFHYRISATSSTIIVTDPQKPHFKKILLLVKIALPSPNLCSHTLRLPWQCSYCNYHRTENPPKHYSLMWLAAQWIRENHRSPRTHPSVLLPLRTSTATWLPLPDRRRPAWK